MREGQEVVVPSRQVLFFLPSKFAVFVPFSFPFAFSFFPGLCVKDALFCAGSSPGSFPPPHVLLLDSFSYFIYLFIYSISLFS